MKSRIEDLEEKLKGCLDRIEKLESTIAISGNKEFLYPENHDNEPAHHRPNGLADGELPPFHKTLLIVERYLATTNTILPLFHPGTLLQTVKMWYDTPQLRNRNNWAVINVVLALGHCLSDPDDSIVTGRTSTYLNQVQSVLTELILGDPDLVIVQVVIGMALLFQSTNNLKPAAILTNTALNLAHSLGLHIKNHSIHLGPTVVMQRDRVFWMAYILDRDISMRTAQPPVQRDEDISLDLPPLEPGTDHAGFVFAPDSTTRLNFFRVRIQLARIQGKVYDQVYSVLGQSAGLEETNAKASNMLHLLDDWTSQIPIDFQATTLIQTDPFGLSRQFCILYSSSHLSRFLISKASSWDPSWVGRLQDYGSKLGIGEPGQVAPVPQMPQGWAMLLRESRQFMALFMRVNPKDASFVWYVLILESNNEGKRIDLALMPRITSCPYISSLVCLTAEAIFNPNHELLHYDHQLIEAGMLFLNDLSQQSGLESLQRIFHTCEELHSYIRLIS
jgi:hypothetical protein